MFLQRRKDPLAHARAGRHILKAAVNDVRSPARERRDSYVGTFSLSSRSGLQLKDIDFDPYFSRTIGYVQHTC